MKRLKALFSAVALTAVLFVGQGAVPASAGLSCPTSSRCYSLGYTTETENVSAMELLFTVPSLTIGDANHINESIWISILDVNGPYIIGGNAYSSLEMGLCMASNGTCGTPGFQYLYAAINGRIVALSGPPGLGTVRSEYIIYSPAKAAWEFLDIRNGVTHDFGVYYTGDGHIVASGSGMVPQVGLEISVGSNGLNSSQTEPSNGSHAYLKPAGGVYRDFIVANRNWHIDNPCTGHNTNCLFGGWNGSTSQWIHGKDA